MHDNEDGQALDRRPTYAERMLKEAEHAARIGRGLNLTGQARPPDPLEEQAQAWRLYGSFLEHACMCRDAFARAKLNQPAPLTAALEEADGQTIAEGKD